MASDTVGFKEIYRRFCLKDTCQSGLTDSPLAMSVLQQSEASLLDALLHQQKATIPETDRFIIHAAADWPEGLRLMISHGVDCSGIAYNGASALDYACSYGNPVSVWLLLEADAPVTQYTWHHAIQSQNMDIINKVAEALHRAWQETSPDDMACQSMFCLLYQDWALAIDSAQAAFDAGFVDVDMHLHSDGKDLLCSTPLWTKAQTLQKQDLSDTLDLLEWLVERGASLDFIPCGHTTMPAHVAAERIAILCSVGKTYERYEDESLANELSHPWLTMLQNHADFLSVIYSSDHIDHCNCGCSKHGCTVVSAALKTTTQAYSTARPEATDLALKKNILHAIFSFIDAQHKSDDIIAAEILRVLTFDRLQLTHTCHDITRFDGEYFSCPSPHIKLDGRDIADIQYIEQCDLQLLEGLLEEFEDAWKTRQTGSTLLQFLDGHWDRRMSEVIAERLRPRKDEFERLRLVGVERVVFGPERKPERERKLEREAAEVGSWEWFEKEVESIMAAK
ncbi:hypothetical protein BCR34DRAFT_601536 [Clohesyomyces aquaticus]|uniref:Ankyrin repeat-containing domain protein n=1 Tax=Clohesyomyces aquaticus TaxID=1231657 RepID=A0A1Y1ZLZ8_9PLEO|nr:hypothetical protein BCR34DRAFT_601536 [Clohesyomyces aquaticus]